MKKIVNFAVIIALALSFNFAMACENCDKHTDCNCKCHKVCDKDCDCGCKDGKDCECHKKCDCCKNCKCKKRKFKFFRKIKCNCE